MAIEPRDVVVTDVGVMYVHRADSVKTLTEEYVSVTGLTSDGKVSESVRLSDSQVATPLTINASNSDAQLWLERGRFLDKLCGSVYGSLGMESLKRYRKNMGADKENLSLIDRKTADRFFEYLDELESSLCLGVEWVEAKRRECFESFEKFHTAFTAFKDAGWDKPEFEGTYTVINDIEFHLGGIYQFQFHRNGEPVGCKHGYLKVIDVNTDVADVILSGAGDDAGSRCEYIAYTGDSTALRLSSKRRGVFYVPTESVMLLPIDSFQGIEACQTLGKYAKYAGKSLSESLRGIFADTFKYGEGVPACLPSRDELLDLWLCSGNYERLCGELNNQVTGMLYDLKKSINHVRWVRSELEELYRETEEAQESRESIASSI
jgi:hypothetical protein